MVLTSQILHVKRLPPPALWEFGVEPTYRHQWPGCRAKQNSNRRPKSLCAHISPFEALDHVHHELSATSPCPVPPHLMWMSSCGSMMALEFLFVCSRLSRWRSSSVSSRRRSSQPADNSSPKSRLPFRTCKTKLWSWRRRKLTGPSHHIRIFLAY